MELLQIIILLTALVNLVYACIKLVDEKDKPKEKKKSSLCDVQDTQVYIIICVDQQVVVIPIREKSHTKLSV